MLYNLAAYTSSKGYGVEMLMYHRLDDETSTTPADETSSMPADEWSTTEVEGVATINVYKPLETHLSIYSVAKTATVCTYFTCHCTTMSCGTTGSVTFEDLASTTDVRP